MSREGGRAVTPRSGRVATAYTFPRGTGDCTDSVAGSVADMAERVRFELTDAETSAVFKTADGTLPRSQDSTPPHGTTHNFGSNFGSRPLVVYSADQPVRIVGRRVPSTGGVA